MSLDDGIRALSSRIAQVMKGKSDKGHTHASADVTDFTVASASTVVGGRNANDLLARLRTGMRSPASVTTKVVMLGESHVYGGFTPYRDQTFSHRVGFRLGAPVAKQLTDTVAVGTGMQFWNGGINSSNTTNYYPTVSRTKVAQISPDYVIHVIGSNDWSQSHTMDVYKTNLRSALTHIESVNSNVVNILVHGPGRYDIKPTYPFSDYGVAMQELVAELPGRRMYVDCMDALSVMGMEDNNRAGLVLITDNIHMSNTGNKAMADILCLKLGIPIEPMFADNADVRQFPLPPIALFQGDQEISRMTVGVASYPRLMKIHGNLDVNMGNANNVMIWELRRSDDNTPLETQRRRKLIQSAQVPLGLVFYVPPGVATYLILVWSAGTNNSAIEPNGQYTNTKVEFSRI